MTVEDGLTLLGALACVLGAALLGGALARVMGAPSVVGQMCGGVLLGPLLAGSLLPSPYETLFTADNKAVIARLGTISASLFLFVAGAIHPDVATTPRREIALLAGVNAVAAALGALLIIALIRGLDTAALDFWQGCFLCLVFTACAVPVLLRIIEERRLTGHRAARYAVAVAVSTDAVVWCVVALLDGITNGSARRALLGVGILATVLVAWRWTGPRIRRVIARPTSALGVLIAAGGCAALGIGVSVAAGIDPLIGALAGGVLFGTGRAGHSAPPWFLRSSWVRGLLTYVALPIFFASAGLAAARTGSVATLVVLTAAMSVVALGVRAVAVFGLKRRLALDGRERRATLWLICARGGTELALLKIGLGAGLLPAALYAPAVLMAIVTTVLSGVLAPSPRGGVGEPDLPASVSAAVPKGH